MLTSPREACMNGISEYFGDSMGYERTAGDEQVIDGSSGQPSLASRIARWTADRNRLDTPIQGLSLHRWETPTEPESYMLAPSVCLIGQGRKRLFLGEEAYIYDAYSFLITSVDLIKNLMQDATG